MYVICRHGRRVFVKRADRDYNFGTIIAHRDNYKDAMLSARVERLAIKHYEKKAKEG